MLVYGLSANATNEYVKIVESTTIESVLSCYYRDFYRTISKSPNTNDIANLLHVDEQCGFLGMLGQSTLYALEVQKLCYSIGWIVHKS